MDIDSFIVYIKTEDIYVGIVEDLETIFDLKRPLPKVKSYWINER